MMLDYGNDSRLEEILLQRENVLRDQTPPELDWDESEASRAVEEVLGGSQRYTIDYL